MLSTTVMRALPIVVVCLVACNVYNADLLIGPGKGGATGSSGSGATAGGSEGGFGGNGGRASSAGSSGEAGGESMSDAGDDGGGSGGVSGSSTVGEGGESSGGSAGSLVNGGTTGGGGSNSGNGGNAGTGAGSGGSSGESAGSGGAGSGSGGGGGLPGTIEELLIDDLEDGNHQIALLGQVGYWYSYNDGSGTQTPAPADPFTPVTVNPPIDGSSSTKAVHVRWQEMTAWGGGFGATFTEDSTVYYDASAYDGVTFWARVESGSETRVDVILAEERSLAPACTVCGHHPIYALTLGTTWQRFYLPFALFQSDGGGNPSFVDLDPSGLYGIQFFRGANRTVDVWVDDIAFYRLQ
jgi:hypothetical protein